MDWGIYLVFAATQLMFALTPGPAVLLTVSHDMRSGWRASMLAALGVQAGNGIYFTLSIVGLGAVMAASEALFHVIKYVGAGYLIFLGAKTIWNATRSADAEPKSLSLWRQPFVQAVMTQLANPKSVLFFGALMPQFVDPSGNLFLQYVVFAAICFVTEMPILAVYGWLAAQGKRAMVSRRSRIWRERLSGMCLVGVGASLAAIRRAA